jgi:hypothetical protein
MVRRDALPARDLHLHGVKGAASMMVARFFLSLALVAVLVPAAPAQDIVSPQVAVSADVTGTDVSFIEGLYKVLRKAKHRHPTKRQIRPGRVNVVRTKFKVLTCPRIANPIASRWRCDARLDYLFRTADFRMSGTDELSILWEPDPGRLTVSYGDLAGAPIVIGTDISESPETPAESGILSFGRDLDCGDGCAQTFRGSIVALRPTPDRCVALYRTGLTSDVAPARVLDAAHRPAHRTHYGCP